MCQQLYRIGIILLAEKQGLRRLKRVFAGPDTSGFENDAPNYEHFLRLLAKHSSRGECLLVEL